MANKRRTVILDNGHGGLINGRYSRRDKQSPEWLMGVLYEGAYNRWIVNKIIHKLDQLHVPYYHVSPELTDVPLSRRVARANKIHASNPNTYLLSIHGNAGGGSGFEGWTSKGKTVSDNICEQFLASLAHRFKGMPHRKDKSDGDRDKEADFVILKQTNCPALLLELLFMDNQRDYEYMWSNKFHEEVSDCLVNVITYLHK